MLVRIHRRPQLRHWRDIHPDLGRVETAPHGRGEEEERQEEEGQKEPQRPDVELRERAATPNSSHTEEKSN